jgi:hypothetical protein
MLILVCQPGQCGVDLLKGGLAQGFTDGFYKLEWTMSGLGRRPEGAHRDERLISARVSMKSGR